MKIFNIIAIISAAMLMVACNSPAVEGSKEVRDLLPDKALTDSASYLIGINFGTWLKSNDFGELNYAEMLKGIKEFMNAKGDLRDSTFTEQFKIDPNIMNRLLDDFLAKRRDYTGALNAEKGRAFMDKFLQEDGAMQTESGLAYKIIEPGNDKKAVSDQDTVWVDYKGTFIDGEVFDQHDNFSFPLGSAFKGWSEGLKLVGEGGKIKLVIPSDLAYGEGRGLIPSNSTLVFDVTLNKVEPSDENLE